MIVTTTQSIEGHSIKEYLGVVSGETIMGANIFRDLFASVRDIVGGRAGGYEKVLNDARNIVLEELENKAKALGANAVVGVDFDYEALGNNNGMLMVTAAGTAVYIPTIR